MDGFNLLLSIILKSFNIDTVNFDVGNAKKTIDSLELDDDLLNEKIKRIYDRIIEYQKRNPQIYEEMLAILFKSYIASCPDTDNVIVRLLNAIDRTEAINKFSKIRLFGESLITNYITNYLGHDRKVIANFGNLKALFKYDDTAGIIFLNDMLRSALFKLNSYCSSTKETYELIETIFYNDIKIDDKEVMEIISFIREYKDFVMRLIYSDVYEFIMTLDQERPGVNRIKDYINYLIKEDNFKLDPSYSLENEAIFKCFFYLNKERRISNHQLLNDEQKNIIKNIYPLFMFDTSGIIQR